MKQLLTFLLFLCTLINSKAQLAEWPKMNELKLKEIRTSSDNILVAYFLGPDMNEITTNVTDWSLNGKNPLKIDKWVTPNWEEVWVRTSHLPKHG